MKIAVLSFYQDIACRGVERFVEEFRKRLSNKYQIRVYAGQKVNLSKKPCRFLRRLYLDYYSRQIALFTLRTLKKLWQEKPVIRAWQNPDVTSGECQADEAEPRRKHPDVTSGRGFILMPTNNGWQSIFSKIFCLLTGTKLVLAGHSGLGQDDRLNLFLFPDVFVVFSDYQKTWAKKINPWVKIVRIPHAVDLQKFNPQVKPARLALEKPVILCVSGQELFKRVELTIKAIAALQKGSLLLLGKPTIEIINLGKKFLGKRFKQMEVSFEKMPQFYRAADLFTLVSEPREAFGISFLEAMACNLAVVATDDPLRREIIGKAGLFVKNPQDIENYAATLKQALKRDWQGKPRKQAEKFSWKKTATYYQKLFDSLI